jgi:hypothetical protein
VLPAWPGPIGRERGIGVGVSIGAALAEARRRGGLTVAQVSQWARIRQTIIRGIEDDDYSVCGGDFYARGPIRSIAKAVAADPGPRRRRRAPDPGRRRPRAGAAGVLRLRFSRPAHGRYVLLWFTTLPADPAGTFQASVYNIKLTGG